MRNQRLTGPLAAAALAALVLADPSQAATRGRRARTPSAPAATTKSEAPATGIAGTSITTTTTIAPGTGSDSSMTLRGGQEGTVFKTLTVEGEDRIHVDYERPELEVDLAPEKAPGLELGTARDVMDRSVPDVMGPMVATSAQDPCPYLGRPWLRTFATGTLARFRPDVKDVERWRLVVADSRGQAIATWQGKGTPPREIEWDGHGDKGTNAIPGLTYSHVLEAYDEAGNKRNFVGEGFQVPAYRLDTAQGPVLLFSGRDVAVSGAARDSRAHPPIVLETASWLNQSVAPTQPIRVTVTARNAEQGNAVAADVTRRLSTLVLGDPGRVQGTVHVEPDAPEGGIVRIASGR